MIQLPEVGTTRLVQDREYNHCKTKVNTDVLACQLVQGHIDAERIPDPDSNMDSDIQDTHASYIDMRPVQFFDNYGKRLPEVRAAPELQPNHHLAPTPPDKMPASRFRYSPNASPRPCRDACLVRAPQNAPPHRRRLHVQAGTGLAPRAPIKCLHHDSDTARMLIRDHVAMREIGRAHV